MSNLRKKAQSIEPNVAQWANEQIGKFSWKYDLEQGVIDEQVAKALKNALSKQGGSGGCRVDCQLLISNGTKTIPVMVEYKGTKGDFVSFTENLVTIKTDKNEYDFKKIAKYAVNGAVYYADIVLNHTEYKEVLAIGVNGYDDNNKRHFEISAYILNQENPNMPILLGDNYTDLSFLDKKNQKQLFEKIKEVQLNPNELHAKHLLDEKRLDKALKDLNQHLHEITQITVPQRIAIVTPCIMAGIGVKDTQGNYIVHPLTVEELKGSLEDGQTDGDILFNKVSNFLKKREIPEKKREQIENSLKQTLIHSRLSNHPQGHNSPLKAVYKKVFETIIPVYEMSNILDFTGKLFNVMNDWVSVPDGGANDVVLTPRYVTDLMARLCRVNKDSYVWDWALGSGGFLISAMNIMLADAKNALENSPEALLNKQNHIKNKQLLGVEKLPDIYILAVLNMILMNDGSTNIINENSLTEFNGHYAYPDSKEVFKADVFLLNPPYSASGNGMVFVQSAFEKMDKGYGAVIIQDSAGTGKATEFNQTILKNNTLLASIKMPIDLFKASVQTSIYVFRIGEPHEAESLVKFIDFREDGYTRTNRKKASQNLKDTDNAKERYAELVKVVKNGAKNAQYFIDGDNYFEDMICVEKPLGNLPNELAMARQALDRANADERKNYLREVDEILAKLKPLQEHNKKVGNDWNFDQHKKIETKPTLEDFKKTVSDYLAWEVSQILKGQGESEADLGKA